jgi:hypothetical protein
LATPLLNRIQGNGPDFQTLLDEAAKIENQNDQVVDPYKEAAVKALVKTATPAQGDFIL